MGCVGSGDIDDEAAVGVAGPDGGVGVADRFQREAPRIDLGDELPHLGEPGRLAQDGAVMGAALVGEQRQQGDHARV